MIFLDASVLLAAEDSDDPEHRASTALLRTGELATSDLALYETTNIAKSRWRDDDAATRLRERIWMIAELGILIRVDRQLGDEIARLTAEHDLSAYDAAYVAGAQRLGVVLASCDQSDLITPGLAQLPATLVTT